VKPTIHSTGHHPETANRDTASVIFTVGDDGKVGSALIEVIVPEGGAHA
jgi:hypothetical protein